MTIKHRILKQICDFRNIAQDILKLIDDSLLTLEHEDWERFLENLKRFINSRRSILEILGQISSGTLL